MGYGTRAEYTIELIRNPKAYNHIGRYYFATGFILASAFNERALQVLLEKWQQIDAVTSNRIRFLFFIDNETTLGGYPRQPFFTEAGFKRHNSSLLEIASREGFKLSVKAGTQQNIEPLERNAHSWYPQERVRKLAQQFGITGLLPCLVWSKHDNPEVIYAKRIEPLSADDIFALIRDFCDQFYDQNFGVLTEIDQLELQIENYCNHLDLSLQELERVTHLLNYHPELNELLRSTQNLPLAGLEWEQLISSVAEISEKALLLSSSELYVEERRKKFVETKKWAKRCKKAQEFLASKESISVPHLADALLGCFAIEAIIPVDAIRFSPSLNPLFSSDIFADFLVITASGKVNISDGINQIALKEQIERTRSFVSAKIGKANEKVSTLPITKENIVTFVNIRKVLNDIVQSEVTTEAIGVKELFSKVDATLKSVFFNTTLALAITLRLWVYSELRDAFRQMEDEIRQMVGTVEAVKEFKDPTKWRLEVQQPLQQIDKLSTSLNWNVLSSYKQFRLSDVRLAMVSPSPQPRTTEVIEELSQKINRQLIPIGQVMSQWNVEQPLSTIASQVKQYQEAFPSLKVSSGAAKIFISYRRDDSGHATDRIYEGLAARFGQATIFMDLQIPLGTNFRDYLKVAIDKCIVQLVVIGQKWADIKDQQTGKRRLDDPNDLVRIEIERALKRNIAVIPVLIDGASIPQSEQLPLSLSLLADQQAIRVGRGLDFHKDIDRLIKFIEVLIADHETEALKLAQ